MLDSRCITSQAKSHISFYDIFRTASLDNILNKDYPAAVRGSSVKSGARSPHACNMKSKPAFYITSEQYNVLTNDYSCKTLAASTSTIFYDLDDIAKRYSFHNLTAFGQSDSNLMKFMRTNASLEVFRPKSNVIVQECAIQMHPRLLPKDSFEVNSKKVKKKISRERAPSSEIILRDNDYEIDYYSKNRYNKQQKFWSYAKYRTDYTKPLTEISKGKKKDKMKRTQDPCPCQLFSYACPCTGNKSLTELTNKCLNPTHQVTSTTNIPKKDGKDKTKKYKRDKLNDDKLTNTSIVQVIEASVPKNGSEIDNTNRQDETELPDPSIGKNKNKKDNKPKSFKKSRKVLCPNCKEQVDIVISKSTTEEEESIQYENSLLYRSNEMPSTAAYTYKSSPNNLKPKPIDDDLCLHDPPCEMLPVCQILPTDNNYVYSVNQKCTKKYSVPKPPRVIRITKACRHHPPCTVVPSCQRVNVLKNNCEFIPPCLHHPRCVNLPLCIPFSKHLPYEQAPTNMAENSMANAECPHIPRCKYIPACQYNSLSHLDQHQIMMSRVQNETDFLQDYNAQNYLLKDPKSIRTSNMFSHYQITATPCHICKSNKSSQFDRSNCKHNANEQSSNDTVVYIRDVGCQFRTTKDSPKSSMNCYLPNNSSLQSKPSSHSIELIDGKQINNLYSNVHTLRYEDKFTNPIMGMENSFSASIVSIDSECPSHGRRAKQSSRRKHPRTDFHPQTAYVAAYSNVKNTVLTKINEANKLTNQDYFDCHDNLVKSQQCRMKDKYKKMFSRKRKSKHSNHLLKRKSRRTCSNKL